MYVYTYIYIHLYIYIYVYVYIYTHIYTIPQGVHVIANQCVEARFLQEIVLALLGRCLASPMNHLWNVIRQMVPWKGQQMVALENLNTESLVFCHIFLGDHCGAVSRFVADCSRRDISTYFHYTSWCPQTLCLFFITPCKYGHFIIRNGILKSAQNTMIMHFHMFFFHGHWEVIPVFFWWFPIDGGTPSCHPC